MNERKLTMGFNTRGTEDYFASMLNKAIAERTTPGFRYVEIGVGEGTTLISVAELLRDALPSHQVQAVGVDLVDGLYFNPVHFLRRSLSFNTYIEFEGQCNREPFIRDKVDCDIRVLLLKSSEKRALASARCINFALIDGCHGAPCVEKDFLAIEPGMAAGGIVAFHDAGLEEQGTGHQPHCKMPISVVTALDNLQLPGPNSPQARDRGGWKFIGSIDGDKSQEGNGFKFFQRLPEPKVEEVLNPNNTHHRG